MTFDKGLDHHEHGGDHCVDEDHDGCCDGCGVLLDECPTCEGRGYHRAGCSDSEEAPMLPQGHPAFHHGQDVVDDGFEAERAASKRRCPSAWQ